MTGAAQHILDCLNYAKVRATYGAVGDLLGIPAQNVGAELGIRRLEACWVVNSKTKRPSGYGAHLYHPELLQSRVITTGAELRELLRSAAAR